jgi:hypothetical protein
VYRETWQFVHRSLHTPPHQQVRAVDAYESWHEVIVAPLVETSHVVCTQQDQCQGDAIYTSMETIVKVARYTRVCSTVHVNACLKGSMAPKCAFLGSQGIPLMQYARAVMVTCADSLPVRKQSPKELPKEKNKPRIRRILLLQVIRWGNSQRPHLSVKENCPNFFLPPHPLVTGCRWY